MNQWLRILVILVASLARSHGGFVRETSICRHGQQRIPSFIILGGRSVSFKRIILSAGVGPDSKSPVASSNEPQLQNAPVLNGKRVLPFQIITTGLQDHKVFAVYAVLNSQYKRG
jgi:hypothetical protein